MTPLSRVTLAANEPYVRVKLMDGRFSPIGLPTDLGLATIDLAPGIYVAEFETSVSTTSREFLVLPARLAAREGRLDLVIRPDRDLPMQIDASAPLKDTNAYLARDAEIVADASLKPMRIAGTGAEGSLLIVLRRRPLESDRRGCTEASFDVSPWQSGVELFSGDGRAIDLATAARTELDRGLAYAHVALPTGVYELRLGSGTLAMSQYVPVAAGIQTQAFLTDRGRPGREAPLGAAKFSVHFADQQSRFDPSAAGARVAEEFLNLLGADIRPRLMPETWDELRRLPSPMVHLALWLSQVDLLGRLPAFDLGAIRDLRQHLPGVPDVAIIWECASSGLTSALPSEPGVNVPGEVTAPPLLARAWDLALIGENRRVIKVVPGSLAARLGPWMAGGSPWLRFRSRAESDEVWDPSNFFSGIAGTVFDETLPALQRELAGDDISGRVQYNSTHLTVPERRLVALLCPAIDTTTRRILEHAGDSLDGVLPPSEDSLVLALRMPRASVSLVADMALDKLRTRTILPTVEQLGKFVDDEAASDSIVRAPLDLLHWKASEIVHLVEGRALSLLSLLFLLYRGAPARPAGMSRERLASQLSDLGFVHQRAYAPLRAAHIGVAVRTAADVLAEYYDNIPAPEDRGICDDIRIQLTSVARYKPGGLCTVSRRPRLDRISMRGARFWSVDSRSYSLSLPPARTARRPNHTSTSRQPTELARSRYFETALRKSLGERAALPEFK